MPNPNETIAEALEIWKEHRPYLDLLTPYERYLIRHIEIGLRYVAERGE